MLITRISKMPLFSFLKKSDDKKNNVLNVIYPYKHKEMWVFDDEKVGLVQEPFVSGADKMIEMMTTDIKNAEKGFRLIFSGTPFPGFEVELEWRRREYDGNWYYSEKLGIEGWLCPALLKYFKKAPKKIYVKVEETATN